MSFTTYQLSSDHVVMISHFPTQTPKRFPISSVAKSMQRQVVSGYTGQTNPIITNVHKTRGERALRGIRDVFIIGVWGRSF